MDDAERAKRCDQSLADAASLLRSGCENLFASTGLLLDPDYLAHALREPDLSTQVCSSIEQACRVIEDKNLLPQALAAVNAIGQGAIALRSALERLSEAQSQGARAISAYNNNL